jgi:photosystem II stability/assembly factor-like uncharacterized protein
MRVRATIGYDAPSHFACVSQRICVLDTVNWRLLRTTDGGSTFVPVGAAGLPITGIAFAGPAQGVVVGPSGVPTITTDAGATFAPSGATLAPGFGRLQVISETLATLSGPGGALARTVDGGRSWQALATPTSNAIVDTSFVTAGTGFALDDAGAVLRTDDGGSNWQTLPGGGGSQAILALDGSRVLLAGDGGVRLSRDGGQTFLATPGKGMGPLDHLALATHAVLAWRPGAAFLSRDGGARFAPLKLPRHERIGQLDFLDQRVGYLLATDGRVFFTGDGGVHWRELLALGHGLIRSLAFTSSRSGWAAESGRDGTAGSVLRTDDGGQSFRYQTVSDAQLTQLGASGHAGYAVAEQGRLFATASTGDFGAASSIRLQAPRRAGKHGRVTITGRLRPAVEGTQLTLSYRSVAGGGWSHAVLATGTGGGFSFETRIRRVTAFVAQWAGSATRRASGSTVAVVAAK